MKLITRYIDGSKIRQLSHRFGQTGELVVPDI